MAWTMPRAILEAAAKLPEIQLVLSVGQSVNPDELRPIRRMRSSSALPRNSNC
jgi:hypothetical protein